MTTVLDPPQALSAPPRRVRRRPRHRVGAALRGLLLTAGLAVMLYPLVWTVAASFSPSGEIVGNGGLLPPVSTTANYGSALAGVGTVSVGRFFLNSLVISVLTVIGTLASSSVAAYAFARVRFRFRGVLFGVMIGTLLLPVHVLIVPQYVMFQKAGLIDTYVPLLVGKFLATEAFFVFLLVQFIRQLPRELDEAARVDGCGHGRIFWHVILPLMRPALVTSAIFAFIWSWNDFLGPLLFLNSPEKFPLPLALKLYLDQQSSSDFGGMIALSVLALLPVAGFFLLFQRFIVGGLATSGLKG